MGHALAVNPEKTVVKPDPGGISDCVHKSCNCCGKVVDNTTFFTGKKNLVAVPLDPAYISFELIGGCSIIRYPGKIFTVHYYFKIGSRFFRKSGLDKSISKTQGRKRG